MAIQEPFLVNPPKRLRRRLRRNPVGETLVTVGANPMRRRRHNSENPWFGDSAGHRIAALMRWGKVSRGRIGRHRPRKHRRVMRRRVHRKVFRRRRMTYSGSIRDRRTRAYKQYHAAQMKEASSFLGLTSGRRPKFRWVSGRGWVLRRRNPYRRYKMVRRRHRRNAWFGESRRHRRAAKKGWRRGHKMRRKVYRHNPGTNPRRRRSYGRRHRRNPAISIGKFTSSITNVGSWAPLAVTGGLSAITGAIVPSMVGVINPWARLGVQLAVAVGGGMAVENFVDKRHGEAWMIVGVSMVGYQLLKQFVLIPYLPQFAVGLGSYENYYSDWNDDSVSQEVGAYPNEVSAFPNAMSAYPGVGASQEVGAYPYDGSPY